MELWEKISGDVYILLFISAITLTVGAIIKTVHWLLLGRRPDLDKARRFPRQLILAFVTLLSLIATILVLPVSESARNQLIGLLGIFISGMVAFSSTTVVSNFMAGLLLRITKPFRTGDFIRVGDYFGRVSEQGLFDTEIQAESRELISIPNSFLIRNPVATTHNSGTIVSATLSLGYDIDHSLIETLLCQAAEKSGLADPFVHLIELGNYSITYRVSGLLQEVKWLITADSNLHAAILDTLHAADIEIMSPTYMNQRRMDANRKVMPPEVTADSNAGIPAAEEIVFDKAEEAERQETEKEILLHEIEALHKHLKEAAAEERKEIKARILQKQEQLKAFEHHSGEPAGQNGN